MRIELRDVSKSFPGVKALSSVNLRIDTGEAVGLVGENGAGKSTLIKILSGIQGPSSGTLLIDGREVRLSSPSDALRCGIATIHQELAYFPHLSVAENLLIGEKWPRRFGWVVDQSELKAEARRRLAAFSLDLSVDAPMSSLSAAEKQEVAIARALAKDSRLLILDEPTASLGEADVTRLLSQLEKLKDRQVSVLYVSHRLDEVLSISDRVCVLRDGERVSLRDSEGLQSADLVADMLGRQMDERQAGDSPRVAAGETVFEAKNISCAGMFHDVSFQLRQGEILGVAGLVGSGRSELARAIYGMYPIDSGKMLLRDRAWLPKSASEALHAGMVYLPEERKRQAFVLDHSLKDSIGIGFSDRIARLGCIRTSEESERVSHFISRFSIKATGPSQLIGTLSGGNQQKAVIARWMGRDPDILLLDEPTRGVDVGAKSEIHHWVRQVASEGKAVLLISSDLPELIDLSDRAVVLREGGIVAELGRESLSEERVLLEASGVQSGEAT